MGFFDRFRGDALTRAEKLLERGDPRAALTTLGDDDREAANSLRERARTALVESLLARADGAEQAGYKSDAVDWLRTASEEAPAGSEQQAKILERLAALSDAVEKETSAAEEADVPPGFDLRMVQVSEGAKAGAGNEGDDEATPGATGDAEASDDSATAGYVDDMFQGLASMLRDEIADHYYDQPPAFHAAWVQFNEGQARQALESLAALGDHPIVRFERGRAHWAVGEAEAAIEHFEAAHSLLGDEPLDLNGNQSLPQLWAEAMLHLDRAQPVVERLAPLVIPGATEPAAAHLDHAPRSDLAESYGRALVGTGKAAEAVAFLGAASQFLPKQNDLRMALADAYDAVGESAAAIDELERLLAPSCSTGSCNRPPLDIAAARALIGRYLDLDDGAGIDPARAYLERLIVARQGNVALEDCGLLARYFHAIDEPEMAAQAEAAVASGKTSNVALEGLSLAPGNMPPGGGLGGGKAALG